MSVAPLRSATCRIAAHRLASPRPATQRSDYPAASAPRWPENHPTALRNAPRRAAAHRAAPQRSATQR
jgi:hypothetical protein